MDDYTEFESYGRALNGLSQALRNKYHGINLTSGTSRNLARACLAYLIENHLVFLQEHVDEEIHRERVQVLTELESADWKALPLWQRWE